MATSYPGAIDSLTNPTTTDTLNTPSHAGQHANANDAIEAIETAIGVKYGARVLAKRTTNLAIVTGTDTLVALTAEDFDTDSFHSTSVNTDRLTIPANMGGVYLIIAQLQWDSSTAGSGRTVRIWKNGLAGTALAESAIDASPGGSLSRGVSVSCVAVLAAGDYVGMGVFQNSGANLDIEAAGAGISLCLVKIA